jgi:hypothetical protein
MLKAKTDFKCILLNPDGTEALKFDASTAGDLVENASFVGGGIASGGQALTIWTEKRYEYRSYHHSVIVDGFSDGAYKLVSVQTGVIKRLGAQTFLKPKKVYILSLE